MKSYVVRYLVYVTDQNGKESDIESTNVLNANDEEDIGVREAKARAFDSIMAEFDLEEQPAEFFEAMEDDGLDTDGELLLSVRIIEFMEMTA